VSETGNDEVGPSLQMALQNRAEIKEREGVSAWAKPVSRDPKDVEELNRLREVESNLLNEIVELRRNLESSQMFGSAVQVERDELQTKLAERLNQLESITSARDELQEALIVSEGRLVVAKDQLRAYVTEVKGLREDRDAAELREAGTIRERDQARETQRQTESELARLKGAHSQRFSAGNFLIDCGNPLDASPDNCFNREGIWFPDGKGTKLCYRCLVRQSQRLSEELKKLESLAAADRAQEQRNAEYCSTLAVTKEREPQIRSAYGDALNAAQVSLDSERMGRRIVMTPMLEPEKLAMRIANLEERLETLHNEVKGGRWG